MEQARADELAVAQIQILCIISVSSARMLQLFILFPGGLLSISVSCLIRNSLLAFPMFASPRHDRNRRHPPFEPTSAARTVGQGSHMAIASNYTFLIISLLNSLMSALSMHLSSKEVSSKFQYFYQSLPIEITCSSKIRQNNCLQFHPLSDSRPSHQERQVLHKKQH
jgi:hypothetical protein